jgi:hypothetical protein
MLYQIKDPKQVQYCNKLFAYILCLTEDSINWLKIHHFNDQYFWSLLIAGYIGDGYVCTRGSETEDCRTYNLCDINADCLGNQLTERYQCFCKSGYRGDGIVCIEEAESCELKDNCGTDAECISDDESNNAYYCACNPGFVTHNVDKLHKLIAKFLVSWVV